MPTDTSLADLLRLPAGRELDIAVAEHVMGQTRLKDCPLGDPDCPGKFSPLMVNLPNPCLPHYSTEIAAAWQIIEHLGGHGSVDKQRLFGYAAVVANGRGGGEGRSMDSETPAVAICRAALRAKLAGGGA